jgi:DNA-binding transcriptional regulator of glucitol operon
MVKLDPTHRKLPAKKVLIYLLLAMAVIMVLIGWRRISLFVQTFFEFYN